MAVQTGKKSRRQVIYFREAPVDSSLVVNTVSQQLLTASTEQNNNNNNNNNINNNTKNTKSLGNSQNKL